MSALTTYDRARAALAEAHRVDEVKKIIDQAAAVLEYARRAKDLEMIAWATEIQQDAARKAGQLLVEMDARGERQAQGGDRKSKSHGAILIEKPALADLGVTLTQSSRWQKLAALDDEEFEARKAKASREAVASVAQTRDERQAEKKERRQAREVDLGARIAALPNKRYGVIVADPEWKFKVWSTESGMDRAAENHFPTSELDKIKARDVPSISAPDCALGLWATVPMLPQALEVMAAWGFTYKSNHDWIKHRAGTGYWNRNMHEHFLIGVRGNVPAPAMGDQWPSVIEAPAGKHSAKPEIFLEMMEQYFPSLPKLEMNCRGLARPNWDAWGWESEQPAEAAE